MAPCMDAIQSERPQTLCTEAPAGVEIDGIQLIVTICVLAMSLKGLRSLRSLSLRSVRYENLKGLKGHGISPPATHSAKSPVCWASLESLLATLVTNGIGSLDGLIYSMKRIIAIDKGSLIIAIQWSMAPWKILAMKKQYW